MKEHTRMNELKKQTRKNIGGRRNWIERMRRQERERTNEKHEHERGNKKERTRKSE